MKDLCFKTIYFVSDIVLSLNVLTPLTCNIKLHTVPIKMRRIEFPICEMPVIQEFKARRINLYAIQYILHTHM